MLGELVHRLARRDAAAAARRSSGAFLFSGDDVEKKVGVLSGGEKSRLVFAKMLLNPANLLLLDEPTNHLDVSSREVLEQALSKYEGTICFVSHDRAFMDAIATKVLEVSDGDVRTYLGRYSDYLWKKEQERLDAADGPPPDAPPLDSEAAQAGVAGRKRGPKSKEQKRREARERARSSGSKVDARKERRKVQEDIAVSEKRIEDIELALLDPSVHSHGEKTKALVNEQRALRARIDELYAEVGRTGGLSVRERAWRGGTRGDPWRTLKRIASRLPRTRRSRAHIGPGFTLSRPRERAATSEE